MSTGSRGRLTLSELTSAGRLAIGGAIAYVICMFLPWFSGTVKGSVPLLGEPISASGSQDGWDVGDLAFFALIVVAGAAIVVLVDAFSPRTSLPLPAGGLVMALGGLATVLVLLKLVTGLDTSPVPAGLDITVSISRSYGIYLALVAAAVVGAGGYLMTREAAKA